MENIKRKRVKFEGKNPWFLKVLYETIVGRLLLILLVRPWVSKLVGKILDTKASVVLIDKFVKNHNINLSLYEEKKYRSYNDFFTRRRKEEYRKIDLEPHHLISPCDCKLSVYPINQQNQFRIKGSSYTITDLLQRRKIAKQYVGGFCIICRLTEEDYHRYCYIDNGTHGKNHFIKGVFHTVKPISLKKYSIYKTNCRSFTLLNTEHFGKVVQMEVGALLVGRIKNHFENHSFQKGEEKGMFEYGGSTIVLLVEPNKVIIEKELVYNTKKGYETIVTCGSKIGLCKR